MADINDVKTNNDKPYKQYKHAIRSTQDNATRNYISKIIAEIKPPQQKIQHDTIPIFINQTNPIRPNPIAQNNTSHTIKSVTRITNNTIPKRGIYNKDQEFFDELIPNSDLRRF